MTATVKVGKAWINGYVYINDSDLILPIEVADGVLNRIDRVVVRFDTVGRLISTVVKKGTFASSPVAPTLVRDADFYELGIADIYIVNGATSIAQGDITDLRFNTAYCGIVNSLITADTTTLFAQYESDFETWFATIQDALDGDTAGNLLNLINANSAEIGDLSLIAETDLVSAIQADRSSLAESVTKTLADITYYVATTGSDTTGDGTSGLPFKTIQFAINKLPQIINHNATINVVAGTYAENLIISGFIGKGKIALVGATSATNTHNINTISILNCSIYIDFRGFNITSTTTHAITVSYCINVRLMVLNITGVTTSWAGVNVVGGFCQLQSCTISNKSQAILATYTSLVLSVDNNGSGNTNVLYSTTGSTLAKSGTQPSGTTVEYTTSGGVIR